MEIDKNAEDSSYTKDVTMPFKRCHIVVEDTKVLRTVSLRVPTTPSPVGVGWSCQNVGALDLV
jgi:hypothetical protein